MAEEGAGGGFVAGGDFTFDDGFGEKVFEFADGGAGGQLGEAHDLAAAQGAVEFGGGGLGLDFSEARAEGGDVERANSGPEGVGVGFDQFEPSVEVGAEVADDASGGRVAEFGDAGRPHVVHDKKGDVFGGVAGVFEAEEEVAGDVSAD